MTEVFPRGSALPQQSPLFWVSHKDRYLRQLLIRDIQNQTNRALLVYFTNCNVPGALIDGNDDTYLAELLSACKDLPVDLLLETNGGATDATEKICSILRSNGRDLRVVVPRRAKSNGTVIALAGREILMGMESELGPIDPSFANVPVEFILGAPNAVTPIDLQMALAFRDQTQKLAKQLLTDGMLNGAKPEVIDELIKKIATRDHYRSHGSVIDAKEATALGLKVVCHKPDDLLWQRIQLLRAMYQHDCEEQGYMKVFEGDRISLVVEPTQAPSPP